LHLQDLDLVKEGKIVISSLITIRKGELALNPLTGKVQPTGVELVKIVGTGRSWDCCYYDQEAGCIIYANRPQACRVLKCWDTEEILQLVEKNTLSRFDILSVDDPLIAVIEEHERICPCHDLGFIWENMGSLTDSRKYDLEKRVGNDLRFRERVVADFQLKLNEELFYFGRPFFQLLQPLGVKISESSAGISLHWNH